MKQVIRTLLACCREASADASDVQEPAPLKPQSKPVEVSLREDSSEPEVASLSQPVEVLQDESEEEQAAGQSPQPAEDSKPAEVSAEETLVPEIVSGPKKKRERKSRKREQAAQSSQKKPSFKNGPGSAKDRSMVREGLHKPLPPSAMPLKSILKKR